MRPIHSESGSGSPRCIRRADQFKRLPREISTPPREEELADGYCFSTYFGLYVLAGGLLSLLSLRRWYVSSSLLLQAPLNMAGSCGVSQPIYSTHLENLFD